jgi:hypothetical protein
MNEGNNGEIRLLARNKEMEERKKKQKEKKKRRKVNII